MIGLVESTKRRIGSVQDRDLEPEKLRRKRIKNIHETLPIGGTKIPSIGDKSLHTLCFKFVVQFFTYLFERKRSRSSSSDSNSDSDTASRKQRNTHTRSGKLGEVERLAEMERQRAAQAARIM